MFFFLTEFLVRGFKVSNTCSSDYSVYDGECTYTHPLHAHFSVAQFVCAHPHIFIRVTHTHGSSVCKKVFASISPSPVACLTHLLLSPYDDALSLSRLSRPHVLAVLTCPKSGTRTRSLAIWPRSALNTLAAEIGLCSRS